MSSYWPNWQSWGETSATNATSITIYPQTIWAQPLPGVLESPSAPLTDREWLNAQIVEVCAYAT